MKKEFKVGDRVKIYDHMFVGNQSKETVTEVHPKRPILKGDGKFHWFHFRQCVRLKKKEKSVRVTRKMLAEAWDFHVSDASNMFSADKDPAFPHFCKDLGLPEEK